MFALQLLSQCGTTNSYLSRSSVKCMVHVAVMLSTEESKKMKRHHGHTVVNVILRIKLF